MTKIDRRLVVAFQGDRGCNSHMAADAGVQGTRGSKLPHAARRQRCSSTWSVGQHRSAVLPIENSLHGSVFEHYDLLAGISSYALLGETMMRIRHNVIAAPGVKLEEVRRVMSHPVALSQCRKWLRLHAGMEAFPAYDTAGSVKQLDGRRMARCGGHRSDAGGAGVWGGGARGGIEDHPENYTRFYVLAKDRPSRLESGNLLNKASVAFSVEHRPGSLVEALGVFERGGLNLTKIESRPVQGKPVGVRVFCRPAV